MDIPLARYSFRRSALEQMRTYTLYPDRLEVDGVIYPLDEVQRVHLKYEHTKQREYYQCFVHTRRGRIDLRHVHWQAFAKFEDRRATYTPFVRALLAETARRPHVHYRAGSMANFVGAIVGIPVMGFLVYLCIVLGQIALAGFAGFMLVLCLLMLKPSRPRRLDPLAPPADLLP